MKSSITAKVVPVGNSRGIRIPKTLLEQSGLKDSAELEVRGRSIVITPSKLPRQGWEAAMRAANPQPEPDLAEVRKVSHRWDETEWQW